jgi:hypothetical protein
LIFGLFKISPVETPVEMPMGMEQSPQLTNANNSTKVSIVYGATTLGDKAFSPESYKSKSR